MRKIFFQLVRFVGIGFLNTAVDFTVLNFLAALLGIYAGTKVGALSAVSFSAAVIHSFFWNKYWAFAQTDERFLQNVGKFAASAFLGVLALGSVIFGAKQQLGPIFYLWVLGILGVLEFVLWKTFSLQISSSEHEPRKELFLFLIVSIVGVLLNSGLVATLTRNVNPILGLNKELWLNVVKAGATAVSLIWNFLGYKIFVFRK